MKVIKLVLQYDGAMYSGWQVQVREPTVQGTLEKALHEVTKENLRITGASRTDAGVHAFQQVATFPTASRLEPDIFRRALNANLPQDIRVVDAGECPSDFHPRYSAKNKTYSYLISRTGLHSVFLERYSWGMPGELDCDAMKRSAQFIIGRHDFSSFRASGCSAHNPVREILDITIDNLPSLQFIGFSLNTPLVKISIQANAFLRHMVRTIIGTLVERGQGKGHPEKIKEILDARDRRRAGKTAPARGLFLEKIEY